MNERGGIITGWLFRVVVGLALFGVLAFEGGAVIVAIVGADSAARTAAQDGVAEYARAHRLEPARKEAEAAAKREGAKLVDFRADAAGAGGQSRATAVVEKEAKTIFIHRIPFLKRFTRPRSDSTAYFT